MRRSAGIPDDGPGGASVTGVVDRETLAKAFAVAIGRHPLLRARVAGTGSRLHWVAADPPGVVEGELPGSAIDLRLEPGLRCGVAEAAGGTTLTLDVHHACCDGGGVLMLLEDWLGAYQNIACGREARDGLRLLNPQGLATRNDFPPLSRGGIDRLRHLKFGLVEAVKFALRTPRPLAAAGNSGGDAGIERTVLRVDQPLLKRLRSAAAARQSTVNDLLVRDALAFTAKWNEEHGGARSADWLRLLMPCDLRSAAHDQTPAANVMGYSFLTRRQADCLDGDALLDG